ncbi:MAG: KOW domain-containing RNA-binding protein [Ruminiclostridium sp.]|nr:KOW domain-containing RNA-binding protein [Ruminiclostridium sp.]
MELAKGTVVISRAGRDKGKALAVVGYEGDFVLVADGKERPIAKPKKKNRMHLTATRKKVRASGVSDRALRRALAAAMNGTPEDKSVQESE